MKQLTTSDSKIESAMKVIRDITPIYSEAVRICDISLKYQCENILKVALESLVEERAEEPKNDAPEGNVVASGIQQTSDDLPI